MPNSVVANAEGHCIAVQVNSGRRCGIYLFFGAASRLALLTDNL